MLAGNLALGESATKLYFNLNPSSDASELSFHAVDNTDAVPNSVTGKTNAFKADGDGWYDIFFDMPPPPGNHEARFTDDERIIYDIRYDTGGIIDAGSFNFLSLSGGGQGVYLAAAHIQGIGAGEGSGWIGVIPEPGSLLLLGSGLIGLVVLKKQRHGKS